MIARRLRSPYFLAVALASVLVVVLVAGCTPSHPQSTFDSHGPVAEIQMVLFYWILGVSVVVFVIVGGGLLYTVIRFRRRPGQGLPRQVHGNTPLEIGWTVVPAIVLAVVAVPTLIAQFYVSNTPKDALEINVTAHQWWWEIEYPDLGVVTSNELHVPVGKAVGVNLTSADVVHSFWVPKLAGKMDMFPGKTTTMWFMADDDDADPSTPERDPYFGQCAEFCGESHAYMRFRVFAESQEEFEAWVKAQRAEAIKAATPEAQKGARLFVSKGCIACHAIAGVPGAVGTRGPNLTHFASRTTLAAGILDMSGENLTAWLTDPEDEKPGNIMASDAPVYVAQYGPGKDPVLALGVLDVKALVAYLQSLE